LKPEKAAEAMDGVLVGVVCLAVLDWHIFAGNVRLSGYSQQRRCFWSITPNLQILKFEGMPATFRLT
jgi:hypothetical protein